MSKQEVKVSLVVECLGDSPDAITHILEMQPGTVHNKGDQKRVGNTVLDSQYESTTWIWHASSPNNDVEEALSRLVSAFESKSAKLKKLVSRNKAEISIVAYFDDINPGFHLPPQLLSALNNLGVGLDFDLYFIGED